MRTACRLWVLLGLAASCPTAAVAAAPASPSTATRGEASPPQDPSKIPTRTQADSTAPPSDAPPFDYRAVSALGLTSAYGAFGAWTWLAWYRDKPRIPAWRFGGDGGFGLDTYAGGADKLGHVWAASVLTRSGADLLEAGGWEPLPASALASSLCLGALSLVEVNDGFYTEFSPADLAADVAGVGAAFALRHVPGLDQAIDFRVEWFPTREFRREPGANFAEDYSGQTYLLAFKPRALASLRNTDGPLFALQFVNPVLGFQARGFEHAQARSERTERRQTLLLGLTFDVQAILDVSVMNTQSTSTRVAAGIGRTLFEYVNLPLSTRQLARATRDSSGPVLEQ